jgi:hypothetical protein
VGRYQKGGFIKGRRSFPLIFFPLSFATMKERGIKGVRLEKIFYLYPPTTL